MSSTVAELDVMPPERAAQLLGDCCGSTRWVSAMVARRPFGSMERLLSAADEAWRSLGPDDWREAFSHHPRIGERQGARPQSERGAAWAAGEQAGVGDAGDDVRQALANANREYERRFGYIYIVCATGRTADELFATVTERLRNDPDTELSVAAEEQRRITRLRLEKLLGQQGDAV
ncbi:MAG: 2-oxo-4-hydroxy-4-carboxy-5-ureidoimidazoline decarboxylase [Gemmatimonadaceae bacterium]